MKEFLSQRGITWAEKYVDTDRQAAIEMVRRSGQQGVPVTVIGDHVIVGFDRVRLERAVAEISRQSPSQSVASGTRRKSLGAKVADAGRYTLPGGTSVSGAFVGGVNSGSPAERAGVKAGDVIVAVNGSDIRSVDELSEALAKVAGATAQLTLARGATRRDVLVQFD